MTARILVTGGLGDGPRAPLLAQLHRAARVEPVLLLAKAPTAVEGVGPGAGVGLDVSVQGVRYAVVAARSGWGLGGLADSGGLTPSLACALLAQVSALLPSGSHALLDDVWVFADGRVQVVGVHHSDDLGHGLGGLLAALVDQSAWADQIERLDAVRAGAWLRAKALELDGQPLRTQLDALPRPQPTDRGRGVEIPLPEPSAPPPADAPPSKVAVARVAGLTLVLGMGIGWALSGSNAPDRAVFTVLGSSQLELVCGGVRLSGPGPTLVALANAQSCQFTASTESGTVARAEVRPVAGDHACTVQEETLICSVR